MRYLLFVTAILFATNAPNACLGQSKEDAALKTVMANTSERGYQAAAAEYRVGVARIDEVIQWSFRQLNVSVAPTDIKQLDARALRLHLTHMDKLRHRANVEWPNEAHKADYYYQQARGLLARVDDEYQKQWSMKILDLARLQGDWVENRSKRLGKDQFYEKSERGFSFFGGLTAAGFVRLNPKASPKTIDIFGRNEDGYYSTYGIYKFEGNELRFAEHQDDNEKNRPVSFDIGDNDEGIVVYTFKRKQPDEKKADE